jgi:hypothetical protein
MNWTRYILAAVGGFIALAVVGGLWHFVIFAGFYGDVVKTMQPATATIVVGDILRALVLAYVYPIGFKGGTVWVEGIRFGVAMGVVAGLPAWILLSSYGHPVNMVGSEFVFLVIQGAIQGVVVALIFGPGAAKAR